MVKPSGRHPHHALNAVKVRSIKKPRRHGDGNGLYPLVDESGAKRWILRTVIHNRRTDIGLGGLSLVSLAEAREEATRLRKIARDGGDPIAERRKARSTAPTFQEAARSVHAAHAANWRNEKHAAQWISTLEEYVFAVFGSYRVDQVDTPEVLRALSPIWLTKPETARRVRQRIGVVLDWAKAAGHRGGDNPVHSVTKGLPKQNGKEEHHAALQYVKVHGFIETLRTIEAGTSAKLAFEFLILTATRTSEVLLAKWDEIDEEAAAWTIPPVRMKSGREHRVPLSPRALQVIKATKKLGGEYIFPGRTPDKPLSNMVFLMMLRRMGVDTTAHGFRSSFRDWSSEHTNYPREVCEAALAHVVKDKTEAAYRRGDLFEKRRQLMDEWARHCATKSQGHVVPIRTRKSTTAPAG
jgi:integrase